MGHSPGKTTSPSGGESREPACRGENFSQLPGGDASLEASSARPCLLHGGCLLTAMLPESVCTLGQHRGQRTEAHSPSSTRTNEARIHTTCIYRPLANTPCTNSHSTLVNILPWWLVGSLNALRDLGFTATWTSLIFPPAGLWDPDTAHSVLSLEGAQNPRLRRPLHRTPADTSPHTGARAVGHRHWCVHAQTHKLTPPPFLPQTSPDQRICQRSEAAVGLKGSSGQQPS